MSRDRRAAFALIYAAVIVVVGVWLGENSRRAKAIDTIENCREATSLRLSGQAIEVSPVEQTERCKAYRQGALDALDGKILPLSHD